MKVFVTGAAGFAGSGLVKRLLLEGKSVTALDIVGPYQAELLRDVITHKNLRYKWKSVHDVSRSDIRGHDIVIHLAAEANVPMGFTSPQWTVYQNVNGAINLLEACRDQTLKKAIYAGSGNEWGRPLYLPIDEKHPLTPHNPYAFSKAASELAFMAWHRAYGIPAVIMSNGIVSGPNMRKDIFLYRWLKNIILNRPVILEGGNQTRDLTFVDDVIDAWLKVINAKDDLVVGEKFQVSYGEELKLKSILDLCFDLTGKTVPIIRKAYRAGERGQREQFSNAKARQILSYSPRIDPSENIRRTYRWMHSLDRKDL